MAIAGDNKKKYKYHKKEWQQIFKWRSENLCPYLSASMFAHSIISHILISYNQMCIVPFGWLHGTSYFDKESETHGTHTHADFFLSLESKQARRKLAHTVFIANDEMIWAERRQSHKKYHKI